MVGQGVVDFCEDIFGQACITDDDHRFQVMGQFTQMAAMAFR
jgi:hypothetical protein